MEEKVVLVTGIGGNVGQGIIRNIRSLSYNIKIIGTNVIAFTEGNHLCDATYITPYAYDDGYVDSIVKIVKKEIVDLILPSTDYESYYLSKFINKIACTVVTSPFSTLEVYIDKYKTYNFHKQNNIPFAQSVLPSHYKGEFNECIAKPREGRGSRGIEINPKQYNYLDKDYLIQELHRGKELTTAFYVTKDNELHGFISLERSLSNGATKQCEVVTEYDDKIKNILLKIINCIDIKGSANMQFIVTDKGEIVPFEINCRISGTNSIRHNFGFQDVKYTLQEYLYKEKLDLPKITKGKAIRILMDVIYPDLNDESNAYIY
ncbi:ATP-grasp domain-containing protein [Pseudofulvibacter geojedonensis]|uniref:ATP-grasp domain-containing protein n=1 Tax=Pseudofulvibacter geojedonensis TaxID=1123758 RepID=A0ABW3HZ49_9FLAO